jgi:predicted ester cyclase
MSEENKETVRRSWEEVVNQRNPDLIEEIYPPDFVWHEPDQDLRGYEQAKQYVSTFFAAFPEINVTVEGVIAEGDKAVSRYTIRGTHQGETEVFGPPTGKQVELSKASPSTASHHHPPLRGRQDSRGVGSIR